MKIFDFNIHLPFVSHPDVNVLISQDMNLDLSGIQSGFAFHKSRLTECKGGNILLFNTRLFDEDVSPFFKEVESSIEIATYTALIDFRRNDINEYIDNLSRSRINAVMVNSYLQQISESDFIDVRKALEYASRKGLIVCIDGSYGTSKMYEYNNLGLACYVAENINQVPIVIVHAGGYRVIEAMLLALDKKNVWLDTSFSLPYYENSSIEANFAYVIQNMNSERILFGSDHPYVEFKESLQMHQRFFEKYNFAESAVNRIMYSNAISLFNV